MSEYTVPARDIWFTLDDLVDWQSINELPGCEDATPDLVKAILNEAAQLAQKVVAPTNREGDVDGVTLENGEVTVPESFKKAYEQYVAGGWPSLDMNPEYGGQGLPTILAIAVSEMWQAANIAWSNCPLLGEGAVHAIDSHASDELKSLYLPKMIAGTWTGTMNLTEPQAGTDLALLRSTATRDGDTYLVSGQKIFITFGDHNMAENIVHLVLARLPDAPAGVKGISLFLVPKFLPDADGNPGERNNVSVVSVEKKLGIHGSPTCVMSYENARGWLVGEENNGLACMFTMMNQARIRVGFQGLAIAERAFQHALAYTRERVQGNSPDSPEAVTIVHHPDVRRMLMEMKAQVEAMRAVGYTGAAWMDRANFSDDADVVRKASARVDLMTPIIKGWLTETGQQVASLAVQCHGGMGFIEETGVAQYYRDVRITTIYEGTSGIQALDLVGRKILRDGGAAILELITEMQEEIPRLEADERTQAMADVQRHAVSVLERALLWLKEHAGDDWSVAGAVSYPLMMLTGTACGAWQMHRAARFASERLSAGDNDTEFLESKIVTASFFGNSILPRADAWLKQLEAGHVDVMALDEGNFQLS